MSVSWSLPIRSKRQSYPWLLSPLVTKCVKIKLSRNIFHIEQNLLYSRPTDISFLICFKQGLRFFLFLLWWGLPWWVSRFIFIFWLYDWQQSIIHEFHYIHSFYWFITLNYISIYYLRSKSFHFLDKFKVCIQNTEY